MKKIFRPVGLLVVCSMLLVCVTGCFDMLQSGGNSALNNTNIQAPGNHEGLKPVDRQTDSNLDAPGGADGSGGEVNQPAVTPTPAPSGGGSDTFGGQSFDLPPWPMVAPYTYGGMVKVGEPVYGVMTEENNIHRFSLVIPEGTSEFFGVTLTITASTDEGFEIIFNEYFYDEYWGGALFSTYYPMDFPEVMDFRGRTMTITFPGYEYLDGLYNWEFNCFENQWSDGPDDPNPSDLKLHFAFFLNPDTECEDPFT